jgi:hypothetical protein
MIGKGLGELTTETQKGTEKKSLCPLCLCGAPPVLH